MIPDPFHILLDRRAIKYLDPVEQCRNGEEFCMDFKDCINFANENRVSYVATCDGDQPQGQGLSDVAR